ncbi:helix-turn-helix domain-containing protein [Endozoicomonas sp. ONNA2]|uniref:helix-turn-helix domain-containing protein n=1 Tax=Endozoicomonas sp. ONNA2 TaxID=2828741 RepID=UPI0035A18104
MTLLTCQEKGGEKDRKFVEPLARSLDLLQAFSQQGGVLANQDLARITGLPKPTISRLTYTLTRLGYLVAPGKISAGRRCAVTGLRLHLQSQRA